MPNPSVCFQRILPLQISFLTCNFQILATRSRESEHSLVFPNSHQISWVQDKTYTLPTVSQFHSSVMICTIVFEESKPRKFSFLSLSPSLAKVCASVFACHPICLKRHETKYFCSLFSSIM
uniref:Uncharacterized protein n=1 Tax=Gossypium raimondii TaxID=29730 RepID=A0A0D2TZ27_GOSRA|nr:hypothetical protein B456_009G331500 [Gossypium raimondii]